MKPTIDDLFESPISYPDIDYKERFNSLIGLDDHKERLRKVLSILVNPQGLEEWITKFHPAAEI